MSDLSTLNEHLFSQLKRLDRADLTGDDLKDEIDKSKAITEVSKSIVSNATLQLEAVKLQNEFLSLKKNSTLKQITGSTE